jgi:hypothetical protein
MWNAMPSWCVFAVIRSEPVEVGGAHCFSLITFRGVQRSAAGSIPRSLHWYTNKWEILQACDAVWQVQGREKWRTLNKGKREKDYAATDCKFPTTSNLIWTTSATNHWLLREINQNIEIDWDKELSIGVPWDGDWPWSRRRHGIHLRPTHI